MREASNAAILKSHEFAGPRLKADPKDEDALLAMKISACMFPNYSRMIERKLAKVYTTTGPARSNRSPRCDRDFARRSYFR
jgi:hypothetical protein